MFEKCANKIKQTKEFLTREYEQEMTKFKETYEQQKQWEMQDAVLLAIQSGAVSVECDYHRNDIKINNLDDVLNPCVKKFEIKKEKERHGIKQRFLSQIDELDRIAHDNSCQMELYLLNKL